METFSEGEGGGQTFIAFHHYTNSSVNLILCPKHIRAMCVTSVLILQLCGGNYLLSLQCYNVFDMSHKEYIIYPHQREVFLL